MFKIVIVSSGVCLGGGEGWSCFLSLYIFVTFNYNNERRLRRSNKIMVVVVVKRDSRLIQITTTERIYTTK